MCLGPTLPWLTVTIRVYTCFPCGGVCVCEWVWGGMHLMSPTQNESCQLEEALGPVVNTTKPTRKDLLGHARLVVTSTHQCWQLSVLLPVLQLFEQLAEITRDGGVLFIFCSLQHLNSSLPANKNPMGVLGWQCSWSWRTGSYIERTITVHFFVSLGNGCLPLNSCQVYLLRQMFYKPFQLCRKLLYYLFCVL